MTAIKSFADGDEVTGFFLLKLAEVKQTNATPPKPYFDLILADSTGEISAKLWDISSADKETFFSMMLVKVQGVVQLYRDRLQLKIARIRKVTPEDGCSIQDFLRTAPVAAEDLVAAIAGAAASIRDEEMRAIVDFCIAKAGDKLLHYPAAKGMHHAYYAGLAYHTARMLELGEFIAGQRPFLNAELLKAGIILHDIAKTEEMNAELGVVREYSLTGKLLGHISLVSGWITEAAIRLGLDPGAENVIALQHLVLSHHNLGEWGSPVQPQLPEAVALHHIDQLDAKLQAVEDALDAMNANDEWSAPVRVLENKQIYRMKKPGK
ncbi:3'-5' exoribonuclease [Paenibacillus sp. UNCCL117]|uniref:3'-5' exoribonuclease YhaM family protein n=1 Tax=unclassified Paenibacillus TaxID=185978 RepID=UPI000890B0DE|nr:MULTISPECIES: HD domain-containing protein [unclassified Paenibacillus]SDD97312.1 3'-5' exoribonuclease [Paenibacillus sp. cl123]SFW56225.1 3'-5' exoribonuclease [Paenibacillus sp. UNCCL117]